MEKGLITVAVIFLVLIGFFYWVGKKEENSKQ